MCASDDLNDLVDLVDDVLDDFASDSLQYIPDFDLPHTSETVAEARNADYKMSS